MAQRGRREIGEEIPTSRRNRSADRFLAKQVPSALDLSPRPQTHLPFGSEGGDPEWLVEGARPVASAWSSVWLACWETSWGGGGGLAQGLGI